MPTLLSEKVVTLEFEDLLKRSPIVQPAQPLTRSPGIHQSGVLSYIAHQIGVLKPNEKDEDDPTAFPLLWALGCAWEEYMASFYPDMDWQPGEITVDGVSMNCDGLSLDVNLELDGVPWESTPLVVEEFKFTFKSEIDGAGFVKSEKFWMWRQQVACYAYGYGARVSRHHVCHVRGAYKEFGPTFKQYVLGWSEKELRQVWSMVQSHKHLATAESGTS